MTVLSNFLQSRGKLNELYRRYGNFILNVVLQKVNLNENTLNLSLSADITTIIDSLISSNNVLFAKAMEGACRSIVVEKDCVKELKDAKNDFLNDFGTQVDEKVKRVAGKCFDSIIKALNECMGRRSLVSNGNLLRHEVELTRLLQNCPFPISYSTNVLNSKVYMLLIDAIFILSWIHYLSCLELDAILRSRMTRRNSDVEDAPEKKRAREASGSDAN